MAEPNYDIDKEAIKAGVDAERDAAIKESDAAYDSIISTNKATEQGLLDKIGVMDENGNWNKGSMAYIQTENANEQTEFAIEEINQQKENTRKDYLKEQSGAYKDWQKQADPYGVNAEQRAAAGMANTGYSESAQVSMYNQYQNRVATARESYVRAVQNYDNAITQARLQNSSVLAEIAAETLAKSLEVSLNFASQNNALLTEKVRQRTEISNNYYNRYLAVLDQINKENSLKEQVRQHNETLEENKRQYDETLKFQREQFDYQKQKDTEAKAQIGGSSGGSGSGAAKGAIEGATIGSKNTKNSNSGSSTPKVNTDSLVKAGLAGASASKIDEEIRAGRLVEYEKNGQLYYKRIISHDDIIMGTAKIGGKGKGFAGGR